MLVILLGPQDHRTRRRQITLQTHGNLLEGNGNERMRIRETRMVTETLGHLERDHQEAKTLKRVSNLLVRSGSTIHAGTILFAQDLYLVALGYDR
jgi:hypothetical protein